MLTLSRLVPCALIVIAVAACSGGSVSVSPVPTTAPAAATPSPSPVAVATSAPSPSSEPSTAPSAPSGPTTFTSTTYGYSLTLPAGWTSIQATERWDGTGAPSHDAATADQFVGPGAASAWLFTAPTSKDLAGRVKEAIAANVADHSDTCPPVPSLTDPITVGGDPGTLISFDCGILINIGVAVHDGTAYVPGFRDTAVHAATDPTDRATFLQILESVEFPS